MAVETLDDSNFSERLQGEALAVVDFYAGWCGPCRMFAPKFRRLSEDERFAGKITFFKLDGEQAPLARKTVEIDNLPYFAIYKNGELVAGKSTAKEEGFTAFLEEQLGQ